MPLQKNALTINFGKGLDTKTDPFQISPGNMLELVNSVFNKGGQLTKRNGYGPVGALPDDSSTFLTTYKGALTAIGDDIKTLSRSTDTWVAKGSFKPLSLSTLSLIRNSINQSYSDIAVADSGVACLVYADDVPDGSGGVAVTYKYAVLDTETGQNIIAGTTITVSGGTVATAPKVFLVGSYFVIIFGATVAAADSLRYFAINSINNNNITSLVTISTSYDAATTGNFDAYSFNNSLFIAWNGADIGGGIRITKLSSHLSLSTAEVIDTGFPADLMSVTVDSSSGTGTVYVSWYDNASDDAYIVGVTANFLNVMARAKFINNEDVANLTSVAQSGVVTVFYEINNDYSYDSIATHYTKKNTITSAGVVGVSSVLKRSVGLASKAFIYNDLPYVQTIFYSAYQPSYFLIDSAGTIAAKLAYSNGGPYLTRGLPNATILDGFVYVPYLIKDLLEPVNKEIGATSVPGVYSQLGVSLVIYNLADTNTPCSEIGNTLNLSGGFLWIYDGYYPVESGFHVWPDALDLTAAGTGGNLTDQTYNYVATYEWADNQGNVYRSAPSIPAVIDAADITGSTNKVTIEIPTLRLTAKISNPVKIVIYRWSTGQQIFYQVTSSTSPLMNNTAVDSVEFVDTLADTSIIGNPILYTTGGVIENIAPPSFTETTLYKSRLFGIDAENQDLLWFSKQVIQNVPVDMSDLFTMYVAPTTGAQQNTGRLSALAPLDDKLILFKGVAIYYIVGTGPDNAGGNNDFSEPVFVTSTVGCTNQRSIVFIPQGLLFESNKGIWLLGRDLTTTYIGSPVEEFTQGATVLSAVNVPGTNQVRFTMSSGITIMYDYYFGQWGTFKNVPALSATIFEDLHTYLDQTGQVFQETLNEYLDNTRPVTMSFRTGWFNLAGLQGYQRAYWFYLLGVYKSPHKVQLRIAFDYESGVTQQTIITPDNYTGIYGSDNIYGGTSPFGGPSEIEQWRIFLKKQKCESFQIIFDEIFDPSFDTRAGAGLTLSGISLYVGAKKSYTTLKPSRSAG